MAGRKRTEECKYGCGAQLTGYSARRYHYTQKCPNRPGQPGQPTEAEPPEEENQDSDPLVEAIGKSVASENDAPDSPILDPGLALTGPAESPAENTEDEQAPPHEDIETKLGYESRLDILEGDVSTIKNEILSLPAALENVNAQIANIPKLVDEMVRSLIFGENQPPPGNNKGNHEGQPGQSGTPHSNIAGDLLGKLNFGPALSKMIQDIDISKIAMMWTNPKVPREGIEGIIVNLLKGDTKKTSILDTGSLMKFFTRGIGQTQSALRMKGIDPNATALSIRAQAEEMLKLKLSSADQIYWHGRKSEADAFLAAEALKRNAGSNNEAGGA